MSNSTGDWFVAHASVRGKSHIDGGIPNQDAIQVVSQAGSECFAIAVSDGAGSAKRAEEGSAHFSRYVSQRLFELASDAHGGRISAGSRNLVNDRIIGILTEARVALDPSLTGLRDFHCNLMAIAIGPKWGIRVHLGDAVLLKSSFQATPKEQVDYFVNTRMTAQERTEYANETHFVTQDDWTKHLLWDFLDPNGPEDMYALMTDGAADIALGNIPGSSERKVFRPFFAPLVANVLSVSETERGHQIEQALASPQTFRLTGDDKTLALVIRQSAKKYASLEPLMEDSSSDAKPPTTPVPTTPPATATATQAAAAPAPASPIPNVAQAKSAHQPGSKPVPPTSTGSSQPPSTSKQAQAAKAYAAHAPTKTTLLGGGIVLGLLLGLLALPTFHWIEARALPKPPATVPGPAEGIEEPKTTANAAPAAEVENAAALPIEAEKPEVSTASANKPVAEKPQIADHSQKGQADATKADAKGAPEKQTTPPNDLPEKVIAKEGASGANSKVDKLKEEASHGKP